MKNSSIYPLIILLLATLFSSCKKTNFNKEMWAERATEITMGCETDYEKAKAIYDWMCQNIIYDYTYSIYHADKCWENRTGVCNAFSELYLNLAEGCGLSAKILNGICRNSDNSDGTGKHAWNMVETEKGWILLDATWGSCNGHADNLYNGNDWETYGKMSRIWFDVDPDWMIFTHFPSEPTDQLRSTPLPRNNYLSLPNIKPTLGFWGWNAASTLGYFLQHPSAKAPVCYLFSNEVWDTNVFLEYPYSMEDGHEYTIRIRNLNPEYLPSSNCWDVEDDVYSCTATAGFTLYIRGCGIVYYPSASKPKTEDGFHSITYPCEQQ